jgi:Sulfotransferase domain
MRLVGAGLGRTGTMSLKLALERLLGAPCYHMLEVFQHPQHVPLWHAAVRGEMPDWQRLFAGWAAAVDWPAAAFWPELSAAFPDAVVLLSVRDSQSWWRSASSTIFPEVHREEPGDPWLAMVKDLMAARFTSALDDPQAAIAAYEGHNARVRATVPAERLVEWRPGDGWQPLCAALGVPVPDEPFPHRNSTEEFRERHKQPPER